MFQPQILQKKKNLFLILMWVCSSENCLDRDRTEQALDYSSIVTHLAHLHCVEQVSVHVSGCAGSARSAFVDGRGFVVICRVFSLQGAAPGQNALLPETRGDRKSGPEGAGRRRLQVSSTTAMLWC